MTERTLQDMFFRTASILTSSVVLLISLTPGTVYSQNSALSRFNSDKREEARKKEADVLSFTRTTGIPISFSNEEGNHFLLTEIRDGRPIYRMTLNAEASITTNVSGLRMEAGLGFDLQGKEMRVAIFDDGLVKDHIELENRVVAKEGTQEQNHATHVTGTIIAKGINPSARGMAPKAEAYTYYFDADEIKMSALSKSDQNSLLLSSHSYGETTGWYKSNNAWKWTGDASISSDEDFRFGFYGDRTRSLDQLAFLAPYYSIIWAAGNDRADVGSGSRLPDCNGGTGYDCIIPDAVAKNVITVGAINKVLNYNNSTNVQMSFFSSWGPTDDGRIKPDLVGAGVNLFSLSSNGTNTYTTLSGTSMATPNVAGSLLLLQELYSRLNGGSFMRASTLKALAIHTARESGSFPGPDYSYGWGLVNATAAAQLLCDVDHIQTVLVEHELANNGTFEVELHPKINQKITATITWTDPAGTPVTNGLDPTNLMLVNDLDMRITDEQGGHQFPWILDPLNPAKKASRGDNFRDNVEKIEFDAPQEKMYKLTIGHKGQLAGGHQNFSLILTYKTADVTPKTYYWIGDSGAWSDSSHWSLTSGGAPALTLPSINDKVVIDENSFDGAGSDFIALTDDVSVSAMLWLDSKVSGIDWNDKSMTISKRLTIGSDSFFCLDKGIIHLLNAGIENGEVSIKKASLSGITMVADGKWNLAGEIGLDELKLSNGFLGAKNASLILNRLTSNNNQTKEIDLTKARVTILESSDMKDDNFTLHSDSSTLISNGTVSLNWQGVKFNGHLVNQSGTLVVNGNNQFSKVTVQSKAEWRGSNRIDELDVQPGTQLTLGDGSELVLNSKVKLTGKEGNLIKVLSHTKALLSFSDHYKYCFDYLDITNVDVKDAAVNAGLNSTITNGDSWQQKKCDDVLFADFKAAYNCANALTEFIDASVGLPDQWQWDFGNGNMSSLQNTNYQFGDAGTYPVSLKISKNGLSQIYSANITIKENTIAKNSIAVNGDEMTSLLLGDKYQWYKNGDVIKAANQRSYSFNDEEGLYYVVVYKDQCNLPSDSVTVTGLGAKEVLDVVIYPNPASEKVAIKSKTEIRKIEIIDMLGHIVFSQYTQGNSPVVDISELPPSIYFVRVLMKNSERRKQILVKD